MDDGRIEDPRVWPNGQARLKDRQGCGTKPEICDTKVGFPSPSLHHLEGDLLGTESSPSQCPTTMKKGKFTQKLVSEVAKSPQAAVALSDQRIAVEAEENLPGKIVQAYEPTVQL